MRLQHCGIHATNKQKLKSLLCKCGSEEEVPDWVRPGHHWFIVSLLYAECSEQAVQLRIFKVARRGNKGIPLNSQQAAFIFCGWMPFWERSEVSKSSGFSKNDALTCNRVSQTGFSLSQGHIRNNLSQRRNTKGNKCDAKMLLVLRTAVLQHLLKNISHESKLSKLLSQRGITELNCKPFPHYWVT